MTLRAVVLVARNLREAQEWKRLRPDLAIDILVSPLSSGRVHGLCPSAVYVAPAVDLNDYSTRRLLTILRRCLVKSGAPGAVYFLDPADADCALCHNPPAGYPLRRELRRDGEGPLVCVDCAEGLAYQRSLTPAERAAEERSIATYVEETSRDA